MEIEYEATFTKVEVGEIVDKLKSLGAECIHPERLMRRVVFDDDSDGATYKNSFVRVRDEGIGKITMTYKYFAENKVDGVNEVEVEVSDFDKAVGILEKTGLTRHALQENRRETWLLDGVKIEIDKWPWIKPFIEIEGNDEKGVRSIVDKLGLDWGKAKFGDVTEAYIEEFDVKPIDVGRGPDLLFSAEPPKDWKRK